MNYEFKDVLSDLLREKNFNRSDLARELHIATTTINDYFNVGFYHEIHIALKMCKFFDCSMDYLFGLSDDKKIKYQIDIDKISDNFIRNLSEVIKENKISIAKAMKSAGLSEGDYYRWKKGQFPKTSNLVQIAKYFDVSIDYLIGRSDML